MRKRIFLRLLSVSIVSALFMVFIAITIFYYSFEQSLSAHLKQYALILAPLMDSQEDESALLSAIHFPYRLTVIDDQGRVTFDNQSPADSMDNHLTREEIQAAAVRGEGYAKRESSTLFEVHMYYAMRMQGGSFLRVSASQKTIGGLMGDIAGWMILGFAGIIALSAVAAKRLTERLVEPIDRLDFENPLSNELYDEFSPMLRRMAQQNQKIASQMKELSDRQVEMDTMTGSMREGLLIIDGKQKIVTMNQSAAEILRIDRNFAAGKALIALNRDENLRTVVASAGKAGTAQMEMESYGRTYLVSASVIGDGQGMAILLLDSTDAHKAEQARKRFTANVSHELRTPLTAISGYAEMMANHMVQPHDIPVFSQKIFRESQRLLYLIEDILHLSKLDEGHIQGKREPVNLLFTANAVQENLAELAKEKQITLQVEGDSAEVHGDPLLLEEMLRNLVENGIKYNRPGGHVTTTLRRQDGVCTVTVADDGIGIPKEHQSKVFERFYRVDSSRSQATGGTGLGLSIVKHGAEYHHATVALQSEEGVGTTVELRFPIEEVP